MPGRTAIFLLLVFAAPAHAQPSTPSGSPDPLKQFEIQDNSFLVEEAFNQEQGIYQNILNFVRSRDAWLLAFTQEWPLGGQTHQLSYTIPFGDFDGSNGVGDVLLNYRYQVTTESDSRPAFSPRFSVILPTGGRERGFDTVGYQVNLPISKQHRDWYLHGNAGFTSYFNAPAPDGTHETFFMPQLAASAIWRAQPMVHLMMETTFISVDDLDGRRSLFTLSPGLRVGKNIGDAQVVFGAAVPVTWSPKESEAAGLLYFSYELPFRR